jgi:hypothetical protein
MSGLAFTLTFGLQAVGRPAKPGALNVLGGPQMKAAIPIALPQLLDPAVTERRIKVVRGDQEQEVTVKPDDSQFELVQPVGSPELTVTLIDVTPAGPGPESDPVTVRFDGSDFPPPKPGAIRALAARAIDDSVPDVPDFGGDTTPAGGVTPDAGGGTTPPVPPAPDAGTTPAPGTGGTTPVPDIGGTTPVPDIGGTTPAPDIGGTTPAPAPDAGTVPAPAPAPDAGTTPAPAPDAGTTPAPAPAPVPAPDTGTGGTPLPTPDTGAGTTPPMPDFPTDTGTPPVPPAPGA